MPSSPRPALYQSTLHSLPLMGRGKVRDNYAVGDDRMLMVTSDRLSAFPTRDGYSTRWRCSGSTCSATSFPTI